MNVQIEMYTYMLMNGDLYHYININYTLTCMCIYTYLLYEHERIYFSLSPCMFLGRHHICSCIWLTLPSEDGFTMSNSWIYPVKSQSRMLKLLAQALTSANDLSTTIVGYLETKLFVECFCRLDGGSLEGTFFPKYILAGGCCGSIIAAASSGGRMCFFWSFVLVLIFLKEAGNSCQFILQMLQQSIHLQGKNFKIRPLSFHDFSDLMLFVEAAKTAWENYINQRNALSGLAANQAWRETSGDDGNGT